MKVQSLYRHPVKGFTREYLESIFLEKGKHFLGDRIFAVEDGPSGFDPNNPKHISKMKFVVLARSAKIGYVHMALYDQHLIEVWDHEYECRRSFDLDKSAELEALSKWLTELYSEEFLGPLRVIKAPDGHRFVDHGTAGFISLINVNSVSEISKRLNADISPLRFRGNILFEAQPWEEDSWETGCKLQIGDAELEIICPTVRCKATHANPGTHTYDLETVPFLMKEFGRNTCGVYAKVSNSGKVSIGDEMRDVGVA